MRHLFIGGIADGQWIDVPDGAKRWQAGAPSHQMAHARADVEYNISEFVDYRQSYLRGQWRTNDTVTYIFRYEELSEENAMDLLIRGYRRPR